MSTECYFFKEFPRPNRNSTSKLPLLVIYNIISTFGWNDYPTCVSREDICCDHFKSNFDPVLFLDKIGIFRSNMFPKNIFCILLSKRGLFYDLATFSLSHFFLFLFLCEINKFPKILKVLNFSLVG